jgi:hypothetical protein
LAVHLGAKITPGIPLQYPEESLEVECDIGRLGFQGKPQRLQKKIMLAKTKFLHDKEGMGH